MWILLAVGFLIPFVYFGYLMSKLDKFLTSNSLEIANNKLSSAAIVLGESNLTKQVVELLEKDRIQVFALTQPFLLKQNQNFQYMFALSQNDADNLIMCKIGKSVYCIDEMISICNEQRNEGLFTKEKIRYMSGEWVTAQLLYKAVMKDSEVEL